MVLIIKLIIFVVMILTEKFVLSLSLDCAPGDISFSITIGNKFLTKNVIGLVKDVYKVEDCIQYCKTEQKCQAFNFKTTQQCQLLAKKSDDSNDLTSDEYNIYGEKICVPDLLQLCPLNSPWMVETIYNFNIQNPQTSVNSSSEIDCAVKCLKKKTKCSSASFDPKRGLCHFSQWNLDTTLRDELLTASPGAVYLEPGCQLAADTCGITEISGRIAKTVDSVYEGVFTRTQCKELCKKGSFRCRSFDWNEIGFGVCRLSHHTTQSSRYINSGYLSLSGARIYEMTPCYNVTVVCTAESMIVQVQAQSIFRGKIYTKTRPHSCMNDVRSSNEFELSIGYKDVRCSVQRDTTGGYTADVIIQHHDVVITSLDVGFHARCEYGMNNLHVKTAFQLPEDITDSDTETAAALIAPPNITMRIADQDGNNINTAKIGDPLSLIFDIGEESGYRMFIKDLMAMDGADTNQILLIDSKGCPSNPGLMESLEAVPNSSSLRTKFDAFKFPSSDTVQFQALVTLCMPTCAPVQCPPHHIEYDYYINEETATSIPGLNSTRNRRMAVDEDEIVGNQTVIVAGIMVIMDRFPFNEDSLNISNENRTDRVESNVRPGITGGGGPSAVLIWILLLCVQMLVLILWLWAYKKQKRLTSDL